MLVLLDLVDDRDQEDDGEYHRTGCCYEEVQECVETTLAVIVRLLNDRLRGAVECDEDTVEAVLHHEECRRLQVSDHIEGHRSNTVCTQDYLHDSLPDGELVGVRHVVVVQVLHAHVLGIDLLCLDPSEPDSLHGECCLSIVQLSSRVDQVSYRYVVERPVAAHVALVAVHQYERPRAKGDVDYLADSRLCVLNVHDALV